MRRIIPHTKHVCGQRDIQIIRSAQTVVVRLRAGRTEIRFQTGTKVFFIFFKRSKRQHSPPILLFSVFWGSFAVEKQSGREANHSTPSSAEDKNTWSSTSTPPTHPHNVHKNNSTFTFVPMHLWQFRRRCATWLTMNNGRGTCTAYGCPYVHFVQPIWLSGRTLPRSLTLGWDTWIMGQNNRKQPGEVIRMMSGESGNPAAFHENEQGGTLTRKRAISHGGALFPQVTNNRAPGAPFQTPQNKTTQTDNKTIPPLNAAPSSSPLHFFFFSHC